jgi:IclR family transcriptional regulator, acetate operon repressor
VGNDAAEETAREGIAPRRAGGVQSVDRALDVIEALAGRPVPLGVSEIARVTDLPQGTVHRLLLALQARGYVRRDAERKYAIGAAAVRFSEAAHQALASASRSYLARVVELCGETSNLAVLEDTQVVYVAQSPSPHTLRTNDEVGRRVPVHSTAVGKALLTGMPNARVLDLLFRAGMAARTAATTTDPARFVSELGRVRERGYALDDEEQEHGVRCVAVPVHDQDGVAAAISVSGPAERFSRRDARVLSSALAGIADEFAAEVFGRTATGAGAG